MVRAITYDRKATIAYLTDVFREGLLRGTDKELALHDDTLHMTNIVSRTDDNSRIKATMEMNVSITYDFENIQNQLTRHMKVLIAGLSKKEAISRLINDGHVKEVDISFSPFWIRTVSSNIDNIEFIIKK
jgi:phosphoribosylaminoimidazole carboxylase (NCAIR synthetase)